MKGCISNFILIEKYVEMAMQFRIGYNFFI